MLTTLCTSGVCELLPGTHYLTKKHGLERQTGSTFVYLRASVISVFINHSLHRALIAVVREITFHPVQAPPLWKVQDQLRSIDEQGS